MDQGGFEAFLLQPGDMPFVPDGVADALALAYDEDKANIVLPQYQQQGGRLPLLVGWAGDCGGIGALSNPAPAC